MPDATTLAGAADALYTVTFLAYSLAAVAYAADFALARRGAAVLIGTDRAIPPADRGPVQSDLAARDSVISSRAGRLAMALTLLAAAAHGVTILARGLAADRIPLGNMFEIATMVVFVGVLSFLVVVRRQPRLIHVGLFVMIPTVIGLVLNGLYLYAESGPLVAALRSGWLVIHVTAVSIGFGAFLTSGIVSALYLVRARHEDSGYEVSDGPARMGRRLPAAETLDLAAYRLVIFGFPIFTFAVIVGAIWAENAWGRFWGWDPKETWSFIAFIVYAAYLHARATAGWKGRAAAWINVGGLVVMVFNLVVVNLLIAGLHSYAGVS